MFKGHPSKFACAVMVIFFLMMGSCSKQQAEDAGTEAGEDLLEAILEGIAQGLANLMPGPSTNQNGNMDCGYAIDSSQGATGTFLIYFTGDTCNGLCRTGSVSVTLQNCEYDHWKDKGARYYFAFNNMHITNISGKKSVLLNGTHQVCNENGSSLKKILAQKLTECSLSTDQ